MRRIAVVVDDIYEDLELWYPRIRFEEEGWQVLVAGPQAGKIYAREARIPLRGPGRFLRSARRGAGCAPGARGFAPDKIRRDARVLALVREMNAAGKLIGFICHAGWVLISAGILKGKRATSTVGIRDDMVNAGALWVDQPLVVDGNLVSSRTPADLARLRPRHGRLAEIAIGEPQPSLRLSEPR